MRPLAPEAQIEVVVWSTFTAWNPFSENLVQSTPLLVEKSDPLGPTVISQPNLEKNSTPDL